MAGRVFVERLSRVLYLILVIYRQVRQLTFGKGEEVDVLGEYL